MKLVSGQLTTAWDVTRCAHTETDLKQYLSDVLTHILDDHLISSNGLHGKQAPLVDPTASKTKLLLAELHKDRQHSL